MDSQTEKGSETEIRTKGESDTERDGHRSGVQCVLFSLDDICRHFCICAPAFTIFYLLPYEFI